MSLQIVLESRRCPLNDAERAHVRHQLGGLERRLVHFPEPVATLVLARHDGRRQVTADLRVRLGPHAAHLISHQAAEAVDQAVRLAVDDVERQLERRLASQRGEPSFGTPSRRLPDDLRPHPLGPDTTAGSEEDRPRSALGDADAAT